MFHRRLRNPLLSFAMVLAAGLAASLSLPAAAAGGGTHEASIPFAAHNGIRNWQADGSQGLWVQSNSGAWYYGRFSFPCSGLQFKEALRFKFNPDGAFDRWSEVSTREAGRCLFKTFETSAGPPAPAKKPPAPLGTPAAPAASPATSPPAPPAQPVPGN
jgi:hypothetical protein